MLFLGRFSFAQRQTRAMADVQNVNLIPAHGEKNSVFVPAATMKNLTDIHIEKFALGRERTAFRERVQQQNHLQ